MTEWWLSLPAARSVKRAEYKAAEAEYLNGLAEWANGKQGEGRRQAMRLIDADALKELLIDTLESIKKNPKMDGQETHIIAACHMLAEMIDDASTVSTARNVEEEEDVQ